MFNSDEWAAAFVKGRASLACFFNADLAWREYEEVMKPIRFLHDPIRWTLLYS